MMDQMYNFSDKQVLTAISASGVTLVSTNVNDHNVSAKDAWGVSKALEIGDSYFNITVSTTLAGAAVKAELVTKAASASISSGGTVIATLNLTATQAAGSVLSVKLHPGDTRLRYLGVLYTGAGNVTAGNVNAWLGMAPPVHDD